jgi:hypothetical protein
MDGRVGSTSTAEVERDARQTIVPNTRITKITTPMLFFHWGIGVGFCGSIVMGILGRLVTMAGCG